MNISSGGETATMDSFKDQIYRSDDRIAKNLKDLQACQEIPETNKQHILRFFEQGKARELSKCRLEIILYKTTQLAKMFGPIEFEKATEAQIIQIVQKIQTSKQAETTKETLKGTLKHLFRHIKNIHKGGEIPGFPHIESRTIPTKLKKEDLYTHEDVIAMLKACKTPMWQAIISVLYEGDLRPGELLNMRIKDVIFSKTSVRLYVAGKMAKKQGQRSVDLMNSYDLIKRWLEYHPFSSNPEQALWIQVRPKRKYGQVLTLTNLSNNIKKIAIRARVKLKSNGRTSANPYLFRHTGATRDYKLYGEAIAKKKLGHVPASKQAQTYNHLNDEDVLEAMEEIAGIKPKKTVKVFNVCLACHHPNDYTAEICSQCHSSLMTEGNLIKELEVDSDDFQHKLLKLFANPEFRKKIFSKTGEV